MTDRERRMIEGYIPNPRDPELDTFEYYMLDSADRVIKVRVTGIASHDERSIYHVVRENGQGVYNASGMVGFGFYEGWYYMSALYDNKEDCRHQEHLMYDHWERLRELQQKEDNVHVLEKDEG